MHDALSEGEVKMEYGTRYEDLIALVEKSNLRNDNEFRTVIVLGMEVFAITDEEAARFFDVSRPTINRWRNGQTAPHPGMRGFVCNQLKKKAEKLIKSHARSLKRSEKKACVAGAHEIAACLQS